jgi:hypothetical protein
MRHPGRYERERTLDESLPRLQQAIRGCLDEQWLEDEGLLQVYVNGWMELTPGIVDVEAINWYKRGNCAILAVYLHRLSSWPLVMLTTNKETNNDSRMVHVLCRRPDGLLVDIEGATSEKEALGEWERAYSDIKVEDMPSEEALLAVVGDEFEAYSEPEQAVTEDFAHRLFMQYR